MESSWWNLKSVFSYQVFSYNLKAQAHFVKVPMLIISALPEVLEQITRRTQKKSNIWGFLEPLEGVVLGTL